ncbi:MAG: acyl-CoA dehydrogenase family protein [Actinomycetota bacterium]
MDFALSEEQQELAGLAGRILGDRMTLPHLKACDNSDAWYDLDTWGELATANILGIAIPEAAGGLGLGFLDLCMVLREVGRYVAPLPVLPTLVSYALPLARYGGDEALATLGGVAAGEFLGTAALVEYGAEPEAPATTAVADGGGWRIDGLKHSVPLGPAAAEVLVPARSGDGIVVLRVPTDASGLTWTHQEIMNREPLFELRLDGVIVGADAVVGTPALGREVLAYTLDRTVVATCAVVSGVADDVLKRTAHYTTERKQFDRQIGTFQAVGQRLADCFIDNQGIELTMMQAATHLDEGAGDPAEIATAKYWAAEGGNRIGHAALHIHGGISIDLDYPIHRYFLWLKRYEFSLGSATPELLRIGKVLAETPVAD